MNKTLVEKLNEKIAKLTATNNMLVAKVQYYESIIAETEKAKAEYERNIQECRKLSKKYIEAEKEIQKIQQELTEQMQQEITDFKKNSATLLKGARNIK